MTKLTPEQVNLLMDMKDSGKYRRNRTARHHLGYRREVLWQVLVTTLGMYGKRSFKAKEFRRRTDSSPWAHKEALMADCPLSLGEIINAIKYGESHGLLVRENPEVLRCRWILVKTEG